MKFELVLQQRELVDNLQLVKATSVENTITATTYCTLHPLQKETISATKVHQRKVVIEGMREAMPGHYHKTSSTLTIN